MWLAQELLDIIADFNDLRYPIFKDGMIRVIAWQQENIEFQGVWKCGIFPNTPNLHLERAVRPEAVIAPAVKTRCEPAG